MGPESEEQPTNGVLDAAAAHGSMRIFRQFNIFAFITRPTFDRFLTSIRFKYVHGNEEKGCDEDEVLARSAGFACREISE